MGLSMLGILMGKVDRLDELAFNSVDENSDSLACFYCDNEK